jgi:hypothetical protein
MLVGTVSRTSPAAQAKMKKRAFYLAAIASLSIAGTLTWTLAARAGNESAEYRVIESDGNIEFR